MCPGGTNHCRVGWVGSQSLFLLVDFRSLLTDA
jgi:hypothetical protein